MKICITGGAGFIGFHLAQKLHKEGHELFGFDNFNFYLVIFQCAVNSMRRCQCAVVKSLLYCRFSSSSIFDFGLRKRSSQHFVYSSKNRCEIATDCTVLCSSDTRSAGYGFCT